MLCTEAFRICQSAVVLTAQAPFYEKCLPSRSSDLIAVVVLAVDCLLRAN
jgi:hypothetical protein